MYSDLEFTHSADASVLNPTLNASAVSLDALLSYSLCERPVKRRLVSITHEKSGQKGLSSEFCATLYNSVRNVRAHRHDLFWGTRSTSLTKITKNSKQLTEEK
jgi:hypothetical protein